jgi:PAS domain S-box-containing protein
LLAAGLIIAFLATLRNIFQVKSLLDLFEKSKKDQKRLATVMLRANDGILTLDAEGKITSWNNSAEKIFKYDKGSAIGMEFKLLFPENVREQWRTILDASQSSEKIHTYKFVTRSEDIVVLLLSVTLLKSENDKEFVEYSIITKDITEYIKLKENLEKARQKSEDRMKRELDEAKTLQDMLFPKTYRRFSNMEIAGHCFSSSECSGDWWHYSEIDEKVFIWIGDATGHGLSAALITAAARSAVALIENFVEMSPSKAFELLNSSILQTTKGQMQMTFFMGIFDKRNKTFSYANAGHIPPLLTNLNNQEFLPSKLIPLNDVNSPRLGESLKSEFHDHTLKLSDDDIILFYTDGVSEISSRNSEMSFLKNYCNLIASNKHVVNILNGLKSAYDKPYAMGEVGDDITFLIAKIGASSEVRES